jgi:hypothetical protein
VILCPSAKACLFDKARLNHSPKVLSGSHHVDTIQAAIVSIVDIRMLSKVYQGQSLMIVEW